MSEQTGALKVPLIAATTDAVGGVLKLKNPEGADLIITRLVLDIVAKSNGAATVDAGVDDDGDVNSDNLIDGQSVATAGVYDNIKHGGTNGKASVLWPADHYLVITASATTAGMAGNAYIDYIRR